MEFENVTTLKQWFYKDVNDIVTFYFNLTNIILLLMNDYTEGGLYCFSDRIKKCVHFAGCHLIFPEQKERKKSI